MSSNHRKIINQLKIAADNNCNVCLEGDHGTGKTHMIAKIFDDKYGRDNWAYFSGATMDPYVDFIGCPKDIDDPTGAKDKHGNPLRVLTLVRPDKFARDEIRAIFIDEYNRSQAEVRNAVMELIQFKSLNGKKYENLEVIWTAINPSDDEYDVEQLDPAQFDRFHVHLKVDNSPNQAYFSQKYGKTVGNGAVSWWKELEPALRKKVSPRRLDYALDGYVNKNMDLHMFLDKSTAPGKLAKSIKSTPAVDQLKLCKNNEEIEKFLKDENNYSGVKEFIRKESEAAKYIPLLPAAKMAVELARENNGDLLTIVFTNTIDSKLQERLCQTTLDIYKAGTNKEFCKIVEDMDFVSMAEELLSEKKS